MSTNIIDSKTNAPQLAPKPNLCCRIYDVATILVQIAFRVLFIVGSILAAQAFAPVYLKTAAVVLSAVGSTALSGFFFPETRQPVPMPRMWHTVPDVVTPEMP